MGLPAGPHQQITATGTHSTVLLTVTLTFATNPVAGRSVLLFIAYGQAGGQPTPATPSGLGATWTRLGQVVNAPQFRAGEIWIGKNCSGAAKVITFTVAGTSTTQPVAAMAQEWSNIEATATVDVLASTTTTPLTASAITTFNNDLVIGVTALNQINGGSVTGSGFTALTGTVLGGAVVAAAYRIVSNTGTYSVAASGNGVLFAIAIRGAAGPAQNGSVTFQEDATSELMGTHVLVGPLALEVRVCSAADPNGPAMALLDGASGIRFTDVFNGLGAGEFQIPLANPKAIDDVLAPGNVMRFYIGPFLVFSALVEFPAYAISAPEGASGEFAKVQGRQIEAYLERGQVAATTTFTGQNAGAILRDVIAAAQSRGALPELGYDFSATADSDGVAWASTSTLTINGGTDLLQVVNILRGQGVVVRMRDDFVLQVWQRYGRHLESTVMLRQGRHIVGAVQWTRPNERPVSAIVVEGAGGVSATYLDPSPPFGDRREGYLRGPDTTDVPTLQAAGAAEIARREQAAAAISVPITHGMDPGQVEPYRHFRPGDVVGLDVPGRFDRVSEQVAGITIEQADAGAYAVSLSLSALQPDPVRTLAQKLAALSRP